MNDPNLPGERPLDDRARARIRAELTEAAARSDESRPRSWLVPGLAAAAMLGVAALGAGLMLGGNDDDGGRTEEIAPAGSGTANDPTSAPSDPVATGDVTIEAPLPESMAPGRGEGTSKIPKGALPEEEPVTCADEVGFVLSAAQLDSTITYAEGAAELWTDGATWVLCDAWAANSDGGAPTLLGNRATNDPASKKTYAISENYSMKDDTVGQFFAGGPKLPGVESISYTFPDGHTEDAVIEKGMWLMAYVPTSGPLVDQEPETEPIHVEVTMTGGGTASYDLEWGLDTCSQINHGC